MRLLEIEKYQHIWYHGTGQDFDKFDLDAKKANRGTNPAGVYLTQNEELAREYAAKSKNGWVYEVEIEVTDPYQENQSKPDKNMISKYIELLVKHTNYKEEWARNVVAKEFIETGKMKADLDGNIKRAVYIAGGYDSYLFNDMGEKVLVVFDTDDVHILNKFQPQGLVKDPEYDNPIKQPEKEPEAPKKEKVKKPRPGDDDQLGQLLHDFDF